jgi:hypothetical protein
LIDDNYADLNNVDSTGQSAAVNDVDGGILALTMPHPDIGANAPGANLAPGTIAGDDAQKSEYWKGPIPVSGPNGPATSGDVELGLNLIRNYVPELYPKSPSSITFVPHLQKDPISAIFLGSDAQGETGLTDRSIRLNADMYGDGRTRIPALQAGAFLTTLAHEMLHVQQSLSDRIFTHGRWHDQLEDTAELIGMALADKFNRLRKQRDKAESE